jgi:hypothetical protein
MFQVHRCFEEGNHFKAGLADGKIDHPVIDLDLQAQSLIVEDFPAVSAVGITLNGFFAQGEFHHPYSSFSRNNQVFQSDFSLSPFVQQVKARSDTP